MKLNFNKGINLLVYYLKKDTGRGHSNCLFTYTTLEFFEYHLKNDDDATCYYLSTSDYIMQKLHEK